MPTVATHHLEVLKQSDLRAFALHLTQDEDRARDLLQDAYLLIVKHYQSFTAGTNFRAWAKTIVRNTFLSDYRKGQRRRQLRTDRPPAEGWITITTTDNSGEGSLLREDILRHVAALPAIYRDAVTYYLCDLSYREISLRTGVPVGTAKSRVFTARQLLRAQLSDQ